MSKFRDSVLNKSELFKYTLGEILLLSGLLGSPTSIEYMMFFFSWVNVWVFSFGDYLSLWIDLNVLASIVNFHYNSALIWLFILKHSSEKYFAGIFSSSIKIWQNSSTLNYVIATCWASWGYPIKMSLRKRSPPINWGAWAQFRWGILWGLGRVTWLKSSVAHWHVF